jgi:hypothetical protein
VNTPVKLALIVTGAFGLRLLLALFVSHPGIGDPNHYYNLGGFLAEGRGFTMDYIWHYNDPPPPGTLTHPFDHWMPLAGVLAAGGMLVFGQQAIAALLPFMLLGAALALVSYLGARQFGCGEAASLFAAGACALLPELLLNSVRTDTTIPNALFVCASILLLNHGLRRGRAWAYAASGALAGLAYLTRNDAILLLPMLVVTLLIHARWGRLRRAYLALLLPLTMLLVAAPWLIRNVQTLGYATPRETRFMYFFTDQRDHYAYDTAFTLQTMLARQTPAQIIGKRLFEAAAAVKVMYTTLDVFLPVAVAGGLLLAIGARDRNRLLWVAPVLALALGALVFYAALVPYKAQAGSFKKAWITVIPLLLPLAGYALERAISDTRLRAGVMLLALIFTGANGVELARADAAFTRQYSHYIAQVAQAAQSLPDTNGDGEIILMAQDPFMLRYHGLRSVMLPMNDRETILHVARRYRVDYLMMPPDRPALDALYTGAESDPRFVPVAEIGGTNVVLYGLSHDAADD